MPGKNAAERPKKATNMFGNQHSAAPAQKVDVSKVKQGEGFSFMSLLPVIIMVNMVVILTACCIYHGPQKVMRTILLHLLPPNPDAGHVWTIWFAIVGLIVIAIPEKPIISFLMALPSLLIGFWTGALVAGTADWCGKLLCFTIGRWFAQKPVRQFLISTQSPRLMRMLSLMEDPDDESLYLLTLWHFLPIGPIKSYGLAVLDVPFSKLALTALPQAIAASLLLSAIGVSFKGTVHSLRDGNDIEWMSSWQIIVVVSIVTAASLLFVWIACHAYRYKADKDAWRASLRNAEEGESTGYGTSSHENFGY